MIPDHSRAVQAARNIEAEFARAAEVMRPAVERFIAEMHRIRTDLIAAGWMIEGGVLTEPRRKRLYTRADVRRRIKAHRRRPR